MFVKDRNHANYKSPQSRLTHDFSSPFDRRLQAAASSRRGSWQRGGDSLVGLLLLWCGSGLLVGGAPGSGPPLPPFLVQVRAPGGSAFGARRTGAFEEVVGGAVFVRWGLGFGSCDGEDARLLCPSLVA